MIENLVVENTKAEGILLLLPGRGQHAEQLVQRYKNLKNFMLVGATPEGKRWYPQPNGPNDQKNAVDGLEVARTEIEKLISDLVRSYEIPQERIAVLGFSAGAVMAIQVGAHAEKPFLAVVSHSGAILDPDSLPPCRHREMTMVCSHCKDDPVFRWEDRFLPMYKALSDKKYTTRGLLQDHGGHAILEDNVEYVSILLEERLQWIRLETM